MILTCPECASQYSLDVERMGGRPRTVRCAACRATWTAQPPAPPTAEFVDEAEPAAAEAPARPGAKQLPLKIRAKAQAKIQTRKAVAAGAVWGVLGVAVVGLMAAALLFRVEVVRLWPRTAGAYAKAGMTVNPVGLAPENVQAGPGLYNGRAAVVVTGHVRNVEGRAQPGRPLRVSLLGQDGHALAVQVLQPEAEPIPPGQARPFTVRFLDPPTRAADVEVAFALGGPPPARGEAAHGPAAHAPAHAAPANDDHAPAPAKPAPAARAEAAAAHADAHAPHG